MESRRREGTEGRFFRQEKRGRNLHFKELGGKNCEYIQVGGILGPMLGRNNKSWDLLKSAETGLQSNVQTLVVRTPLWS